MAHYAKLWSGITESSLWCSSKDARLLFVTLLAKADSSGYVECSLPGLSRLANLTREETEAALVILTSPDPDSKSEVAAGTRVAKVDGGYCLVNFESYRGRKSDEEQREYMRNYMRDWRANRSNSEQSPSLVNSVKVGKGQLVQEEEEEEEEKTIAQPPVARAFKFDLEAIYQVYPRHVGKTPGLAKLRKVVRDQATYDMVLAAACALAAHHERVQTEKQFIPQFSTWVNNERWNDDIAAVTRPVAAQSKFAIPDPPRYQPPVSDGTMIYHDEDTCPLD
jgi:hypothetical protein